MKMAVGAVSVNIIYFLIIIGNALTADLSEHYCRMARIDLCAETLTHLACNFKMNGKLRTKRINLSLESPSFYEKAMFADKFNGFRNELASGKNGLFAMPAANMKVINWDEELEFLASLSLQKLSLDSQHFCTNTRRHADVSKITQYYNNSMAGDYIDMPSVMERYFIKLRDMLTSKRKGSERLSVVIDAETEAVGCAFAAYETSDVDLPFTLVVTCLFNQLGHKSFSEIYTAGIGCSQCSCLEKCSDEFPELCEYRQATYDEIECEVPPMEDNESADRLVGCDSIEDAEKLEMHFKIIYSLVFVSLFTLFLLFTHYSRKEY